jgi:hypothetical protein
MGPSTSIPLASRRRSYCSGRSGTAWAGASGLRALFLLNLGPLLGLLDMGPYMEISYVTDHALYPPSLG